MKTKVKKKLLITTLMLSGAASILTGCGKYKKFEERAAYQVDDEGYNRITGYVSGDDLDYIYIYTFKDENSNSYSAYFAFYEDLFIAERRVDIFSNTQIDDSKGATVDNLEKYIIKKGYEIKKQYSEEDLKDLRDEYLKDYIEEKEKEKKEQEKNLNLLKDDVEL